MDLTVLTYNTLYSSKDTDESTRMKRIMQEVDSLPYNIDVGGFQEHSKAVFIAEFVEHYMEEFHIFSADWKVGLFSKFEMETYYPFIFFSALFFICSYLSEFLLALLIFLPLSLLYNPHGIIFLGTQIGREEFTAVADNMGLTLMLRKSRFPEARMVKVTPFRQHGYVYQPWIDGDWVKFINIWFCRPGYMAVESGDVLLIASHLTLDDQTPQIEELLEFIKEQKNYTTIIWLGDFNIHEGKDSVWNPILEFGFIDSGVGLGHTFHADNTRTHAHSPKGRIDRIFIKSSECDEPRIKSQVVLNDLPHLSDHFGVLSVFSGLPDSAFQEQKTTIMSNSS